MIHVKVISVIIVGIMLLKGGVVRQWCRIIQILEVNFLELLYTLKFPAAWTWKSVRCVQGLYRGFPFALPRPHFLPLQTIYAFCTRKTSINIFLWFFILLRIFLPFMNVNFFRYSKLTLRASLSALCVLCKHKSFRIISAALRKQKKAQKLIEISRRRSKECCNKQWLS